jgi:hypothetical protein
MEQDAAERLLAKLRRFIAEDLDESEQTMFAMLLAPGISLIYDETEVVGFSMVSVQSGEFAELLEGALRRAGVQVSGIGL